MCICMPTPGYRITQSITIMVERGRSEVFRSLERGSILIPKSEPNAAGMIEAAYEGDYILVFERDLEEASEPIQVEWPLRQAADYLDSEG